MDNAFQPGDPALDVAGVRVTDVEGPEDETDHWIMRDEQPRIDKIVSGQAGGRYYLIIGEKGTGKTSMLLDGMRKINGEGVAVVETHADLEIFRIRLGKALDFEYHEEYVTLFFVLYSALR